MERLLEEMLNEWCIKCDDNLYIIDVEAYIKFGNLPHEYASLDKIRFINKYGKLQYDIYNTYFNSSSFNNCRLRKLIIVDMIRYLTIYSTSKIVSLNNISLHNIDTIKYDDLTIWIGCECDMHLHIDISNNNTIVYTVSNCGNKIKFDDTLGLIQLQRGLI